MVLDGSYVKTMYSTAHPSMKMEDYLKDGWMGKKMKFLIQSPQSRTKGSITFKSMYNNYYFQAQGRGGYMTGCNNRHSKENSFYVLKGHGSTNGITF